MSRPQHYMIGYMPRIIACHHWSLLCHRLKRNTCTGWSCLVSKELRFRGEAAETEVATTPQLWCSSVTASRRQTVKCIYVYVYECSPVSIWTFHPWTIDEKYNRNSWSQLLEWLSGLALLTSNCFWFKYSLSTIGFVSSRMKQWYVSGWRRYSAPLTRVGILLSLSQQHVNRYRFCLFQIWVQMKRIGAKVISLFVLLVLFELWQKLTFNTWWNMRLTPGLDAVKSALCFDVQQQMTATTGTAVLLNWLLFKYNLKRGTCKVSASASKELYELWAMLFSALHFFSGFVIKTQSIMKETLNPWWLSLLFIATVDEPVCCSQLPFGVPVLNDHLSIFVVSLTFCFCLIPVSQLWGRSCCMWTGWMASSGTLRQSSGCTLWLAQRYSREYIQNK